MTTPFRIGITPDFYLDAKGKFEHIVEKELAGVHGVECVPMPPQPGKMATPEALDQFDAILNLALYMPRESLAGVKRLALVARWGVGYDRLDTAALTDHDIAVAITPKAVRRPMAEGVLTFAFALAKRVPLLDRLTRTGQWRGNAPTNRTLSALVLGILGCGNIGQELARLASGLGLAVLACDPYVSRETLAAAGAQKVDLETLFRESDIVSVNALLNGETRGMVGAREFGWMKPTAYFINTARGPIVQHDALVAALKEGRIAGAAIDVFPSEPPPVDDPLFALDNVILAPHAIGRTAEALQDFGREAFENVLAVVRGELPPGLVNTAVASRPGFQRKLERFRNAR